MSNTSDVLSENLSKRIDILKGEIEDLNQDGEQNAQIISEKEAAIAEIEQANTELNEKIDNAKELFSEFSCPNCEAVMVTRDYYPIHAFINGRDCEAEGEFIVYECGYTIKDGQELNACSGS